MSHNRNNKAHEKSALCVKYRTPRLRDQQIQYFREVFWWKKCCYIVHSESAAACTFCFVLIFSISKCTYIVVRLAGDWHIFATPYNGQYRIDKFPNFYFLIEWSNEQKKSIWNFWHIIIEYVGFVLERCDNCTFFVY